LNRPRSISRRCREMEAPEDLSGLAGNGLREIAVKELKARWPRMDAVFYLLMRSGCSGRKSLPLCCILWWYDIWMVV
jgi:hypothetical protein